MSRFSRMLSLLAVPVLFAACSSNGTDTPLSPAGPRHDGGVVLTGSNATPPDTTTTTTTSTTSTSSGGSLDDPTVAPDSTSRGGVVLTGSN